MKKSNSLKAKIYSQGGVILLTIGVFLTSVIGNVVFKNDRIDLKGNLSDFRGGDSYEADSPEESAKWRRLAWVDEKGEIPTNALMDAKNQIDANAAYWQSQSVSQSAGISATQWVSNGPQNVGGRTLSLVINPQNTMMMWAAAASGGIWFTSNGGASWAPVNDFLSTLNAHSLAMHPSDPNIMYCGTGEGIFQIGTDNSQLPGAGIFKSTNATNGSNATWVQLPSTSSFGVVSSLAISPNGNIILATTGAGIHRSVDGGNSWQLYAAPADHVVFDPTDSNKAVAGVYSNGNLTAIYSLNGGATWNATNLVTNFTGMVMAYAPSNPQIVYASLSDPSNNSFKRSIWRSTNGGVSYSLMTNSSQIISSIVGYTKSLWVSPTNPDVIVVGGIDLHKSTDGGITFTRISGNHINENVADSRPHPDQHFLVSDPTTPQKVYVCTDGGIYRNDDLSNATENSGWSNLNTTYQTTQFYGAAGNSSYLIGGTQDNGTLRFSLGNPIVTLMTGGDGGFCASINITREIAHPNNI